jgi:hypothetical protein
MSKAKSPTGSKPTTPVAPAAPTTPQSPEPEVSGAAFLSANISGRPDPPIRFFTKEQTARVDLPEIRNFRYEHIPPDDVAGWLAPYRQELESAAGLFGPNTEADPNERLRRSYYRISWEGPKEPAQGRALRFGGHPYHLQGDGSIASTIYPSANWPGQWRQQCQGARLIIDGASSSNAKEPRDYQELLVCYQDARYPINPMQGDSTHCVPVTTCYLNSGEQAELRQKDGPIGIWITYRNDEIAFLWPSTEHGSARESKIQVAEWMQLQEQLWSSRNVITCSLLSGLPVGRLLFNPGRGENKPATLSLCLNSGIEAIKR